MECAIVSLDARALNTAAGSVTKQFGLKHMTAECELAFRSALLQRLKDDAPMDDLLKLTTFAVQCVPLKLLSANAPMLMLSDVLESRPVDQCAAVFEYIEANIDVWKADEFKSSTNIHLLRMCNDLMKRLSRCIDTALCGRILIFLAKYFPLGEKSGLNMASNFNSDNVTDFDGEPDAELVESTAASGNAAALSSSAPAADKSDNAELESGEVHEEEEVDTGAAAAAANGGHAQQPHTAPVDPFATLTSVPYDFALYGRFWQLQRSFAQPTLLLDKANWAAFQTNVSAVLDVLSAYKVQKTGGGRPAATDAVSHSDGHGDGDDAMDTMGNAEQHQSLGTLVELMDDGGGGRQACLEDVYFAKYLTSQKLFQLQLSDSQFRRYVLLQCVIAMQFLTVHSKTKDKHACRPLDESHGAQWIESTAARCYELMAHTYPNGALFANTVKLILERERTWNAWKNDGCRDFAHVAVDDDKICAVRKRRTRAFNPVGELDMGSAELTRLWRQPPNAQATRAERRRFAPTMEQFLVQPVEQLDDTMNWVDNVYSCENSQWRSARTLSLWANCTALDKATVKQPFASQLVANLQLWVRKTAAGFDSHRAKLAEIGANKERQLAEQQAEAAAEVQRERERTAADLVHRRQAEETAKQAAMASRAKQLADVMEENSAPLVSAEQVENVAKSMGAGWAALAKQLDWTDEAVLAMQHKRANAGECASNVLSAWCQANGDKATVKKLSNLLLTCNLVTPDILHMLQTPSTATAASPSKGPAATAAGKQQQQQFRPAESAEAGALSSVAAMQQQCTATGSATGAQAQPPGAKKARRDTAAAASQSGATPASVQPAAAPAKSPTKVGVKRKSLDAAERK